MIAAILGLALALHGSELRAETMRWLLIDFPPYSAPQPQSGKPGDGAVDQLLDQVIGAWPETVKHEFSVANTRRIWQSLSEGEPGCYTGALHTPERERQAYLSDVFMLPPIQLVVRRASLGKIPRNGSNLSYAHGDKLGANIFKMIAFGRADYTLDYDFVLAQQQREDPQLDGLVVVPVDVARQPLVSSFACPRTPWGRIMIERIDKIVRQLARDPHYRDQLEHRLTPDTRQFFQKDFDEFYRTLPVRSGDAR
jgi:hypothetical protein